MLAETFRKPKNLFKCLLFGGVDFPTIFKGRIVGSLRRQGISIPRTTAPTWRPLSLVHGQHSFTRTLSTYTTYYGGKRRVGWGFGAGASKGESPGSDRTRTPTLIFERNRTRTRTLSFLTPNLYPKNFKDM